MLKIKSLTKSFGEKRIISDLSHDFKEKGICTVIGESGVGKTTLLRMISGLDTEYSGEILGGGFSNVSYAFQEYRLIPTISALDNVIFAVWDKKTEENKRKALDMLKELGISKSDASLMPSELSGGMKQRISLARAFINDSPILLLDEPTKELDTENASLVIARIKELSQKRLIIVVTHKPDELSHLANDKIILEKTVI